MLQLLILKKRIVQVIALVTIIFWFITGVFVYRGYEEHHVMIALNSYINAANRKYEKKIFSDFPYSYSELSLYKQGYMKKYFEAFPFYDAEQLTEEVEYKGSDGTYYYIEAKGNIYYTSQRLLSFSDQVNEPHRVGVQYHLNDNGLKLLDLLIHPQYF